MTFYAFMLPQKEYRITEKRETEMKGIPSFRAVEVFEVDLEEAMLAFIVEKHMNRYECKTEKVIIDVGYVRKTCFVVPDSVAHLQIAAGETKIQLPGNLSGKHLMSLTMALKEVYEAWTSLEKTKTPIVAKETPKIFCFGNRMATPEPAFYESELHERVLPVRESFSSIKTEPKWVLVEDKESFNHPTPPVQREATLTFSFVI